MLYVGNFSYNDENDSVDNYCLLSCLVTADNADEALDKFSDLLWHYHRDTSTLDGARDIYLDSLVELETDESGNVVDTFTYDTYGQLIARTGTTDTPFMYNGRDGVMTDANGLLYMRARYYSPELKRFINADIIVGDLSNSQTLNRYAYANVTDLVSAS